MSFEYDGYGLSLKSRHATTPPTTETKKSTKAELLSHDEQCNTDIQTCYNYLVRNRRISPHNIILYGKSVGSVPVCWLVDLLYQKKKKVVAAVPNSKENSKKKWKSPPPLLGGLVLHSAFVGGLNKSTIEAAMLSSKGHNLPIYIIHGTEDNVIPIQYSIEHYNQVIKQYQQRSFPPFWANGTFINHFLVPDYLHTSVNVTFKKTILLFYQVQHIGTLKRSMLYHTLNGCNNLYDIAIR
jgi:hypothetical protein